MKAVSSAAYGLGYWGKDPANCELLDLYYKNMPWYIVSWEGFIACSLMIGCTHDKKPSMSWSFANDEVGLSESKDKASGRVKAPLTWNALCL